MPDQPPPGDPDDRSVFEALLAVGAEPGLAYTALQRVLDMAAAGLIPSSRPSLEPRSTRETAAAQAAEIRAQRWMVGAILALLG